jgi:HTH-type transcriptional regulator/antitoxin HigA
MTKTEQQYISLLADYRPRIIRAEREHKRALKVTHSLMQKSTLSAGEEELLDLWSLLIQNYEETRWPTPKASPVAVILHLLESAEISQAELARQTGIGRSTISQILSGERTVSLNAAGKLGRFFNLPASSFLPI